MPIRLQLTIRTVSLQLIQHKMLTSAGALNLGLSAALHGDMLSFQGMNRALGFDTTDSAPLFKTTRGAAMDNSGAAKCINTGLAAAGVTFPTSAKTFRHTITTMVHTRSLVSNS